MGRFEGLTGSRLIARDDLLVSPVGRRHKSKAGRQSGHDALEGDLVGRLSWLTMYARSSILRFLQRPLTAVATTAATMPHALVLVRVKRLKR
jgi:hypothetical protein